MSDTLWLRSDDWVGTEVEDSYVMVNVESGRYVALNPTALAIWETVETPQPESVIASRLLERFDVSPEACAAAIARTLAEMRELSLVRAENAA